MYFKEQLVILLSFDINFIVINPSFFYFFTNNLFAIVTSEAKLGLRIPRYATSFLSYQMNYSNYFGSNTPYGGNIGVVRLVRTVDEIRERLAKKEDEPVVFVLTPEIFSKKSIILELIELDKAIAGVVILEPDYCLGPEATCGNYVYNLKRFYEFSPCVDRLFRQFNRKYCYFENLLGHQNYNEIQWPFPVVYLKLIDGYQDNIVNCYNKYNTLTEKFNKCLMMIINYTPKPLSTSGCLTISEFVVRHLSLSDDFNYCTLVTGYNIYMHFNPSVYYNNSIILIITRMDVKSMFDTASAGTQELYPTLTLMMNLASIFHEAKLANHTDILLGFLDNESEDHLGSLRMIYDLKTNQIFTTKSNISEEHILLIIYLDEFYSQNSQKTFLFLYECQRRMNICELFINYTRVNAKQKQFSVVIYKDVDESDFWLKTIDSPKIIIKSSAFSTAKYRKSFLDRMYPANFTFIPIFANIIAKSCLQLLNASNTNIDQWQFIFKPEEIGNCLYNLSCWLLSNVTGPLEKAYYAKFGSPLIAQFYSDGFVERKQGVYKNRLSYVIMKMLVYFLRTSFGNASNCYEDLNTRNFSIFINDKLTCVHANIQVMTDFNLLTYAKDKMDVFQSFPQLPLLMRSTVVVEQKLFLYVSYHYGVYTTVNIIATLMTAITVISSVFFNRNIDAMFPEEI